MGSLRISNAAKADLEEIGRYTQKTYGRAQRREYLDGIQRRFEFLLRNPLICRERTEFSPPVRIQRQEQHMIVYLVDESGVLIVRVLHGSMDIEERLLSR